MRTRIAAILAITVIAALFRSGAADQASPAEREKTFGERYAVLVERNIFAKNRPLRYVPPGDAAKEREKEKRPAATSPEESYILTGVVREGGVFTAFIENSRSGETVKTRIGDAVARGKVSGIDLKGLTYEKDGHPVFLEIGQTLSGGAPSASSRSESASASPASSAGAPATGGSSDLIERMRQRRLQEMKK